MPEAQAAVTDAPIRASRPMRGTGDRLTRWLGVSALVVSGLTAYLGLVVSPPDVTQGNLVRLLYVHPGAATACYVAFGLCALGSLAYLWPRTRSPRWDYLAGASAEVGVVFCGLTLVTGSIWGKPTWGVWWTWDARLTLTALLMVSFVGYLALRQVISDPETKRRVCAVVALVFFLLVPVDHEATTWWQTLHQPNTLLRPDPLVHGWQLVSMLVSFLAYALILAWLEVHRYRVEALDDRLDSVGFAAAIAERRAEAAADRRASTGSGPVPSTVEVGSR